MGKTAQKKRSAGEPTTGASKPADGSTPGANAEAATPAEPVEPLERARLQAEVARQRVRIAKEELKRARKRVKEAKREAKSARKQAAAARKAWKKARKAHRADPAPLPAAGPTRARTGSPHAHHRKRSKGTALRKSSRPRNAPVTHPSET